MMNQTQNHQMNLPQNQQQKNLHQNQKKIQNQKTAANEPGKPKSKHAPATVSNEAA